MYKNLFLSFFLIFHLTSETGKSTLKAVKENRVSDYDYGWNGYSAPDTSNLAIFRNNQDFNYFINRNKVDKQLSPFLRWLRWIVNALAEIISKTYEIKASRYIFYFIFTGLFVFFLFKLFDKKVQEIFIPSKHDRIRTSIIDSPEEPDRYDQLIEESLGSGNYHLAVRFLYLKLLLNLNEKKIISFRTDKTNSEYLMEINRIDIKSAFRVLTNTYDYVWFGKFQLDIILFQSIKGRFDEFLKIIHER